MQVYPPPRTCNWIALCRADVQSVEPRIVRGLFASAFVPGSSSVSVSGGTQSVAESFHICHIVLPLLLYYVVIHFRGSMQEKVDVAGHRGIRFLSLHQLALL